MKNDRAIELVREAIADACANYATSEYEEALDNIEARLRGDGEQGQAVACCTAAGTYTCKCNRYQPVAGMRAVELTVCCGREECGGECGNEWRGMQWVAIKDEVQPVAGDAVRAVVKLAKDLAKEWRFDADNGQGLHAGYRKALREAAGDLESRMEYALSDANVFPPSNIRED